MPDDRPRFVTLTVRCTPEAARLIRHAADRFYAEGPRPVTEPLALGWLLELLSADYLAGPQHPHPAAGLRRLVENRRESP
jgi:hypothetical protein